MLRTSFFAVTSVYQKKSPIKRTFASDSLELSFHKETIIHPFEFVKEKFECSFDFSLRAKKRPRQTPRARSVLIVRAGS